MRRWPRSASRAAGQPVSFVAEVALINFCVETRQELIKSKGNQSGDEGPAADDRGASSEVR
jgi:hypothetical protein